MDGLLDMSQRQLPFGLGSLELLPHEVSEQLVHAAPQDLKERRPQNTNYREAKQGYAEQRIRLRLRSFGGPLPSNVVEK